MDNVGVRVLQGQSKRIVAQVNVGVFVVLQLVGWIVIPVARLSGAAGLMVFLSCVLFRRDLVTPMWAGAGLAASAVVVVFLYQTLLARVAPVGIVVFTQY